MHDLETTCQHVACESLIVTVVNVKFAEGICKNWLQMPQGPLVGPLTMCDHS